MTQLSVDEAAGDVAVVVNAAVAKKWPPAAHLLRVLEVEFYDNALLLVIGSLIDDFTLRTSNERGAPE